ncbi:MAG: hypothetical protein WAV20_15320 [Blastocatellia bacterium]
MKPSMVETSSATARAILPSRRRERVFYVGISVVIATTVVAGFARTYFFKSYFGSPPLIPLLHLHGIVFTSWIVLLLTQTTLVAANRTDIHRRLGMVGGAIAVMMVLVGTTTAITRAKQGAAPPGGPPPLVFLSIPLFDMLVFSTLVAAGFYFRRRPDMHKRLMVLATISILAAAIARLPFSILQAGPPAFFGLTDLFIVACVVYDLISRGRIHRATVWGGLLIILSQPLRLVISGTGAWMSFATWLTS